MAGRNSYARRCSNMPVLSELATMTEVAQGTSLARFGDGELLIMGGKNAAHQKYNHNLSAELCFILKESPCLASVPHTGAIRNEYWTDFLAKYGGLIYPHRWYGSAFVSRDDEVPWTPEYRDLMHDILLTSHSAVILAPKNYPTGRISDHIICASENAYDDIDEYEIRLTEVKSPGLAILCCGPTGTVLADRLTRKGIWAVDLGNFGKFL